MRTIERTGRFKRDYKREKRADSDIDEILVPAIDLLATDAELPESMRDHGLAGDWKGYRDCHLRPDLVLIYRKSKDALRLVRLGSHAELFG
jgi:mRNA interferase YafQ